MARYSKEELVIILTDYAKELGRTPKQNEVAYNKDLPPINQFHLVFGAWNNALKSAGLRLNSIGNYTDEELLLFLKELHKKNCRVPKVSDLGRKNGLPSNITYNNHFGYFAKALEKFAKIVNYLS
mgnify:CR=1 FL=1